MESSYAFIRTYWLKVNIESRDSVRKRYKNRCEMRHVSCLRHDIRFLLLSGNAFEVEGIATMGKSDASEGSL